LRSAADHARTHERFVRPPGFVRRLRAQASCAGRPPSLGSSAGRSRGPSRRGRSSLASSASRPCGAAGCPGRPVGSRPTACFRPARRLGDKGETPTSYLSSYANPYGTACFRPARRLGDKGETPTSYLSSYANPYGTACFRPARRLGDKGETPTSYLSSYANPYGTACFRPAPW
jgi:hypothetical protein